VKGTLRPLTPADGPAFADYVLDFGGPYRRFEGPGGLERFLAEVEAFRTGVGLPPDRVPSQTWFFWDEAGAPVGRLNFRPRLSPAMELEGGHVGYEVRPSRRRRGWGSLLLETFLAEGAGGHPGPLLVTCAASNPASAAVIRRNGGVWHSEVPSPRTGEPIWRFWIEVGRSETKTIENH